MYNYYNLLTYILLIPLYVYELWLLLFFVIVDYTYRNRGDGIVYIQRCKVCNYKDFHSAEFCVNCGAKF